MMKYFTAFLATFLFAAVACAAEKARKVFILAGPSNMEGHARTETFDYIGEDQTTAPLLKMMRSADGKPTVCNGESILYLTGPEKNNLELSRKLKRRRIVLHRSV